jgi:ArsR family transcriptional regulator
MKRRPPRACTPDDCAPGEDGSVRTTRRGTPARRDGDGDATLARLSKAVGHPARVRILRLLAHRTTCVCGDLVDALPLAQSTVSQHLKVLRRAGLVRGTIDGPRVCYCIEPTMLARWRALVATL